MIWDLVHEGAWEVAWDLCEQEGTFVPDDAPLYLEHKLRLHPDQRRDIAISIWSSPHGMYTRSGRLFWTYLGGNIGLSSSR